MNYLMRIKNVIDGLEAEPQPIIASPITKYEPIMNMNYFINLKTEIDKDDNQKNQTLLDKVEEPTKEEPAKEEPTKEEPTKEEPAKQEPTKEEPTKEEPTKEEPTKEEPVSKEPTKEEPIKEEPIKEEPAKEQHVSKEPVKEEPKPVHEESKSTHDESEEVMNNDLKKLSLVLSAADVSASFLLTAKEQSNNSEVSNESLKAALSAAQLSKNLAEELKPGPQATAALNIALAAIAATSKAQTESVILSRKLAELARIEEIRQIQYKQQQQALQSYMRFYQRRY